ncbi:MAG: response regulator [Verrucomicrobia bacterium]|nr:response regulator [Verrucomicrobiota bacterium]
MAVRPRVFVVEDHAATAHALKSYLEVCGYLVETAADVRSAVQFSTSSEFDVLICDLHLPDGTGWELMKKLSAARPIQAIAFSAYDGPEDRRRSKEVGFAEHITKGSNPDGLLEAVRRLAGSAATAS